MRRRGADILLLLRLSQETEFGQVIAQALEFDGSLAFVRIGDATREQFGVIGEHMDTLAPARNGNVELFTVHRAEGA